jgi:uncharacterized membrane protein HdeD (DUF308 family)
MASHPSRDELRSELRRQGLPLAYITRLLSELDDHYEDLLEERSTSMGAARKLQTESISQENVHTRLGEPAQLALFAAERYHSRSFWGRHQLMTFVLGPLPLLMLFWVAAAYAVDGTGTGIAYVCEHVFGLKDETFVPKDHLWAQAVMMVAFSWLMIAVCPLAVAGLLCRIARRNAVSWWWPVVACALLAIVAGFLTVSYRLALEPHEGMMMMGANFGSTPRWFLLTYLPKFAVAMCVGLLLVKRAQQTQPELLHAD